MALDGPPAEITEPAKRSSLRRWLLLAGGVVAIVAFAAAFFGWREYRDLTSAEYTSVSYQVPASPRLVAATGETVYRIDPTRSSVRYSVEEKLFGQGANQAEGTTNGISGDIALNVDNPGASRVGQIVVNVEQLHSDNSLRDARIRADNLESSKYPLAYLTVGTIEGLPSTIIPGEKYRFTMPSQLTVKDRPSSVTWDVEASVGDGVLRATATADVKMSTLGIGPISIAGLVSTADDLTLTMRLTAVDPASYAVPATIEPPKDDDAPGGGPSFETAVMPILQAQCASCHGTGDVGAEHWTLDDAGDAADVADGLGTVVEAGYMPPWPASDKGVPLAHSKRLDPKSKKTILDWARSGGELDVDRSTPVNATKGPEPDSPRQDVVLKMPQKYVGSLNVPNDYRCFVLDPKITKPVWLTGYEVTPGNRKEIHHTQIFHIDAGQAATARERSGEDGKPGWSCYGGASLGSSRGNRTSQNAEGVKSVPLSQRRRVPGFNGQPGLIAGWVPGQDPVTYPERSGIRLEPGDALVFQLHYNYENEPTGDRSKVALQLEPGTEDITPLDIINPIAPVEIPCMPGVEAPLCDRDTAMRDNVRLYGRSGAFIEPGLLALCGTTAEELAGNFKDGIGSTSCDYRVPEDGRIVSVLGHMHTLGKTFKFTLDPETPNAKTLLDIPNWNFNWQMNYQLKKPLAVKAGQTLRMECSWDRSIEPNRAPKYIVFAEGTEDEMCFGTYSIIPDDPDAAVPKR